MTHDVKCCIKEVSLRRHASMHGHVRRVRLQALAWRKTLRFLKEMSLKFDFEPKFVRELSLSMLSVVCTDKRMYKTQESTTIMLQSTRPVWE